MSDPKNEREQLEKVAQETMEKIIRHMQADTEEEDAKRQAERDARTAEVLKKFREEGNYPGAKDQKS